MNAWSPASSTVWRSYGTVRRWSITGENKSLETSFEAVWLDCTSYSLSASESPTQCDRVVSGSSAMPPYYDEM